jgi:hypothetical protein
MAKKKEARQDHEQGMLNNIGGRDEPSPNPAAPGASASIGWMGYVGGVLWATVLGGAGFIGWLAFTGGG